MGLLIWLKNNYVDVLLVLSATVGLAEMVVRFTPTKKDDSAVERIGYYLRKVMDFFKIPNLKK